MKNKILSILEIFLIVVVPFLTIGLDLFENSKLYSRLFNYDKVSIAIDEFKSDYAQLKKRTIFKDSDGEEFSDLWKLIKSYTHAPIRSQPPYAISMLKINNPPTVSLPYKAPDVILIPESAPIVAVYYEFPQKEGAQVPGRDIIIVGTVADLERWFLDKKKNIRIKINMAISLMSILMGLFVHFTKKKLELLKNNR